MGILVESPRACDKRQGDPDRGSTKRRLHCVDRFFHGEKLPKVQGTTRVSESIVGQDVNRDFSIFLNPQKEFKNPVPISPISPINPIRLEDSRPDATSGGLGPGTPWSYSIV